MKSFSEETKFKIIKLDPTDWRKYKKLRLEMLQQEPKAFNSTYEEESGLPSTYWKEKLSNKNDLFVSAKVDDHLVGVMSLSYEENDEPENVAVLHGAYVVKKYRGRGIANQLLEFLINEAKKNPKTEILKLWVKEYQTSAVKLYAKQGFRPVSKAGEHTLVMEKSIRLT